VSESHPGCYINVCHGIPWGTLFITGTVCFLWGTCWGWNTAEYRAYTTK